MPDSFDSFTLSFMPYPFLSHFLSHTSSYTTSLASPDLSPLPALLSPAGGPTAQLASLVGAPLTANAFHVSLPAQQVLIWGPTLPDFDDITKKIEKAGKEIRSKGIILEEGKLPELRAAA
jgi:hypothetical protein